MRPFLLRVRSFALRPEVVLARDPRMTWAREPRTRRRLPAWTLRAILYVLKIR